MEVPADEDLMMQRMQLQGYTYSRRALLMAPPYGRRESYGASQVVAGAGEEARVAGVGVSSGSSFDANVVMILAVLLCALVCALGLNCLVRCALRCSSQMASPAAGGGSGWERPELGAVARLAQAGARRKALRAMPTLVYSEGLRLPAAGASPAPPACAICLADLEPGERVRVLPKCSHAFHVRCVDRWLLARSTCPTCRQPLFGAPPKASGCAGAGGEPEAPVRSFLVPLRPEGFMTPYDF